MLNDLTSQIEKITIDKRVRKLQLDPMVSEVVISNTLDHP